MVGLSRKRLVATQDRQKKYADQTRKDREYEVGDSVLLKVSPWKGVMRFGNKGKLSPRFMGPFEILRRIGPLAYELALPPNLQQVHNVFHVSILRKYHTDARHVIEYEQVPKTLPRTSKTSPSPITHLKLSIKSNGNYYITTMVLILFNGQVDVQHKQTYKCSKYITHIPIKGTVIIEKVGHALENIDKAVLGQTAELQNKIMKRKNLKKELQSSPKVGVQTETELKERKLIVEYALKKNVRCKVDGIKGRPENDEEKVLASDHQNYGYNAATGNYEDLMDAGIIDPTKRLFADKGLHLDSRFKLIPSSKFAEGRQNFDLNDFDQESFVFLGRMGLILVELSLLFNPDRQDLDLRGFDQDFSIFSGRIDPNPGRIKAFI
ncbi:hypothetical protein AgCh_031030 [Apium graveolens]